MRKFLIPLFALVSLLGCPEPPPPPAVPTPVPTPQYFAHTVTYQGENLGKISKWYTGDVGNWKLIASANPKLNPKKLRKGDLVNIPSNLVENSEPMPKKYIVPAPRPARRKAETFVVEENEGNSSSSQPYVAPVTQEPVATPTSAPIITGPTSPVVIEQGPVATAVPTRVPEIPTQVPVVIVEPTKPPPAMVQPTTPPVGNVPSNAGQPDGEKSMEDLVAEEKRVLEQLQKEFQGSDSLAPH